MSTTVCNAYVQPLTERYLKRLQSELGEAGFKHQIYLMISSGGITTLETAVKFPIRLVESGTGGRGISGGLLWRVDG